MKKVMGYRLWVIALFAVFSTQLYALKEGNYIFQCDYWNKGYMALGADHGFGFDVCYVQEAVEPGEDGVWEVKSKNGYYTIRNLKSKKYLSFTTTYDNNCKYLELVDDYSDAKQLWSFESDGYGSVAICNTAFNDYYINVRTNNYLVGCYSGSFRSSNEMFTLQEYKGEVGFPFDLTTIKNNKFENPAWYQIRIRGNKFWQATDDNIKLNAVSETSATSDDYLWAFVKSGNDGFMIYNKQYGTGKCLGSTSVSDGVMLRMDASGNFAMDYRIFHVSDNNNGGYNIYSANYYGAVNDYDQGGVLRFWNNYSSIYDLGSNNEFIRFDPGTIVPVTGLKINDESPIELEIGQAYSLTYTVFPEDATNKAVSWSSSDESVATVSSGRVTAVKGGTAIITATALGGENIKASIEVTVIPEIGPEPMNEPMLFVHFINGKLYAFPKKYISSYNLDGNTLSVTCTWGDTYTYEEVQYANEDSGELPYFTSFKFNNKFNDQLYTDADANIDPEGEPLNEISLSATLIGKRLTPSFKLSVENGEVYVGKVRQYSKKTRQNFAAPVSYIVSTDKMRMLCKYTQNGKTQLAEFPYGREVVVTVDFPLTRAKSVPEIYINTENSQEITSRDYYLNATIMINGKGFFPNMPETSMLIKGRGNTSWSHSKKPYRMKFDSKVKPFDMTAGKNWVLLANAQTNSMMTNAIGHKLNAVMGTAAPNHVLPVDLYINGTYRGSYNFTEKVGFSNNSIDLDDETNAALLELDTYYDEPYKFYSDYYYIPVNIKEPEFDQVGEDYPVSIYDVQDDYNRLETAMNSNGEYVHLVDVDYMCRFLAANEAILNRELMHPKSVFLYSEDVTNVTPYGEDDPTPWIWGPTWDLDWAYGYEGHSRYCQDNEHMNYFDEGLSPQTKYWKALRFGSEEVKKQYYYVWKEFMENHLDEILDYIDDYYVYAQPSFKNNYQTWHSGSEDYKQNAENMKNWLRDRCNYVFQNHVTAYPEPEPEPEPELLYGDANEDGVITVGDITAVLSYLKGVTPEEWNETLADANRDDLITISDIVQIKNLIGDKTDKKYSDKLRHHRFRIAEADAQLRAEEFIASENDESVMTLDLNVEEGSYSSLQFDVTVPAGVVLRDVVGEGMRSEIFETEHRNQYRVVVYNANAGALSQGQNQFRLVMDATKRVAEGRCRVSVSETIIATTQGEDFRLNACSAGFGYDVTGINRVDVNSQQSTVNSNFNIAGQRVAADYKGVVISNGKKELR